MLDGELIRRAIDDEIFGNGSRQISALIAAIESVQKFAEHQRSLQREMQGYKCCEEAATAALDSVIEFIMRVKRGE